MTTLTKKKNIKLAPERVSAQDSTRIQAYVELTKLRISVMVLITFVVAAVLAAQAAGAPLSLMLLLSALAGMFLVAASGNAMNMYLERYTDFLMPRTAQRPLPAQRLSATEVAVFAAVTFSIGVTILFQLVNWQTAVCGIANWILYSFIYTPLKSKHWSNTEIGAIAGAMPVLMGSLSTTGSVGLIGWSFFGVLFFWQFPHFMAIAWKYRDQYRDGGLQMLTVTEPTGKAAGRKAVLTAICLLVVSLIPVLEVRSLVHAILLLVPATILGIHYLKAAWLFYRERNNMTARQLLRSSLFYLPLYMLTLMLACLT
jgi:protoheme IX farnesyltransferase